MRIGQARVLAAAAAVVLTACESLGPNGRGAATHLEFATQPTSAAPNVSLGLVRVALMTADDVVALAATNTITISLVTADTSAHLDGTTVVTAASGIAPFGGLSIDKPGTAFRLKATATGFPDLLSDPFNITP